jgi:hypothetical protein
MKPRTSRRTKDEALLTSKAGSIGSTLGTIAGRAHAMQKALTRRLAAPTVKHEGRKLVRKARVLGAVPKTRPQI